MSTPERTPEEQAAVDAYRAKIGSLNFGSNPGGRLVFRPKPNMSWEKGIQGEARPGGTFMPYVRASDLTPITAKQMADNRGNFERQIREARTGVDNLSPKD